MKNIFLETNQTSRKGGGGLSSVLARMVYTIKEAGIVKENTSLTHKE
ncbi:hypothetical protein LF817_09510 [Halobacillus sp. A1]|nr:hypothetical protein [Halobacillus sp. A1]MCP3031586.1 hypothetical protein [Halobacillus sp. A1]